MSPFFLKVFDDSSLLCHNVIFERFSDWIKYNLDKDPASNVLDTSSQANHMHMKQLKEHFSWKKKRKWVNN